MPYKRIVTVAALALALPGCTTAVRGSTEVIQINSTPSEATAELSTGQSCRTPCSFSLPRKDGFAVTFKKTGCESKMVPIVPTIDSGFMMVSGIFDYNSGAVYNLQPNPVQVVLECAPVANQ